MYILDLDDNLGQTLRKCTQGADPATLRVMSLGSDGKPRSFMTPQQSALFDMLHSSGGIIPCTGRDFAAFKRMQLPFHGCHAVVSFGGAIVMPDGTFEQRWQAHIVKESAQVASTLNVIAERAAALVLSERIQGARTRLVTETFDGVPAPLFVQVKMDGGDAASLQWLSVLLSGEKSGPRLPNGWKIHLNDTTLAVQPPFLRKGLALKFLLEEVLVEKPAFTVGMGDSIDDGGFLGICDFAMMPTGSQIFGLIRKEVTDVPR
jgi:hypothetical protein